jgi:CubicO group peptidase (beta-lactamase class C family)|tara:strand:+ start:100 stop:1272 length:1173 start_codon:yes stop_codon:yes gene_type:complete
VKTNRQTTPIFARFHSKIPLIIALALMLGLGTGAFAQQTMDADSITTQPSQNPEIQVVPMGDTIRELPTGLPFAAFDAGGAKEKELEDFINEQYVAGLLVLQNGKVRLERYALDHNATNLWSSLSVAKSVTSTLLGVAIKDGYIKSIDDPVTDYLPELKGSAWEGVKIRHLVTMTSGIKWNENYTDADSDIALFDTYKPEDGVKAIVGYMRQLRAENEPGKKFNYSTGETHLLGALISAATGQSLSHYLSSKIWAPYGMEQSANWRLDGTGQEMAGCCLQMRLRDFGRFGQFVLEDGYINGTQIVPDDWFKEATQIHMLLWPGGGYGFGWWIFDANSFQAMGIYGQLIYINPSRNLVIAINSAWPEADSNVRHYAVARFLKSVTDEIDKE